MVLSQPSSPVLKARRERRRLYSRILYGVLAVVSSICFIRYVLLESRLRYKSIKNNADPPVHVIHVAPPSRQPPSHSQALHSNLSFSQAHDTIPASLHKQKSVKPEALHLAAVLLVTPETISNLDVHLRTLLATPAALTQLVILTPRQQHADTRRLVQAGLSGDDEVDVEISIELWSGVEQGAAILQAARTLSADWVLLLDEDGLQSVDSATRDRLLLRTRPSEALPLGPRGVDYYLDGITCITPSLTLRRAAYLVPPMVLPVELLPPVLDVTSGVDAWTFLGDYVSRSELSLSGGLVLGSPHLSSAEWCSRYAPRGLNGHRLPIHVRPNLSPIPPHASSHTDLHRDTHPGTFFLVTSAHDTVHVFPLACRLLRQGHHVTVLLLDVIEDPVDSGCALPIRSASMSPFKDGDGPWSTHSWDDVIPRHADIIFSVGVSEALLPLKAILASEHPSAVHIRIPRGDLPYTDWMGTLNLDEWKNWHVPRIELSVITNDRPHSLHRLLSSLQEARYFGDALDLRINIEQTADPETLQMVSEYPWRHGSVFLHHRVTHGGLMTAVVESWYPKGNNHYGLILEDDVELSPLFYAYLKMSLLRYRYGKPEDRSSHLFGISLYQQKNLELRPDGRHLFDASKVFRTAGLPHPHTPYLSQIPCSWGALYFPEQWREFHAYLVTRLSEDVWPIGQTVVPDVRSNRWTRSWKKYFIELVYLRGYVMLYPNYADYVSLSTNHLEVGSHVKDVPREVYLRKKKLFNLPLMRLPPADDNAGPSATGLLDIPDGHLPTWSSLPVLDLLGAIVDQETISHRGAKRRAELTRCEESPTMPYDVRELLCTK
ncbi:hypothetical protein BV20DRAFT_1001271 [Pilatotrama ljubarskyi]|nr:hypothetical protein BV20DRAFT_1001271 [Pilatotrama ljubarskyi]